MSFFNDLKVKIISFLLGLSHSVLAAVEAFATVIETNGGEVLVEIAGSAVSAAETAGGSGSEKLAAAQASVVSTLKSKGLPVVMNAVNAAIEAAVAQMKAGTITAAAPVPEVAATATDAPPVTATEETAPQPAV